MQLMAINNTEGIPMSDTQSICKSVQGLNETGGTIYLANPSISTYVWTITTHFPYFKMPPNQDISYHPNELKFPVFNHRLHLRLIIESVIQNGYKPGLSL